MMSEQLRGTDQRLVRVLEISRDMHGDNAWYLYRKGGQSKVLTVQEATNFCAEHMAGASEDEIRGILDLWHKAFEDADFEEKKRARLRGMMALKGLER